MSESGTVGFADAGFVDVGGDTGGAGGAGGEGDVYSGSHHQRRTFDVIDGKLVERRRVNGESTYVFVDPASIASDLTLYQPCNSDPFGERMFTNKSKDPSLLLFCPASSLKEMSRLGAFVRSRSASLFLLASLKLAISLSTKKWLPPSLRPFCDESSCMCNEEILFLIKSILEKTNNDKTEAYEQVVAQFSSTPIELPDMLKLWMNYELFDPTLFASFRSTIDSRVTLLPGFTDPDLFETPEFKEEMMKKHEDTLTNIKRSRVIEQTRSVLCSVFPSDVVDDAMSVLTDVVAVEITPVSNEDADRMAIFVGESSTPISQFPCFTALLERGIHVSFNASTCRLIVNFGKFSTHTDKLEGCTEAYIVKNEHGTFLVAMDEKGEVEDCPVFQI